MPVANGEPATGVSAPPAATENTDTVLPALLAVASSPPAGLNATESGPPPVTNGEPVTGVSAPPAPTENTDTVLPPALAVASSPPAGLNATECGKVPAANGEPATCVNAGSASAPAAPVSRPAHDNPTTSTARRTPKPIVPTSSVSRLGLGDASCTEYAPGLSLLISP